MISRSASKMGWLLIDTVLLTGALAVAYQLAFDFGSEAGYQRYSQQFRGLVIPVVALSLALLWILGLYSRMMRFAGMTELVIIAGALSVVLIIGLIHFMWLRSAGSTPANPDLAPWQWPVPRSVLGINWLTGMGAVGGARLARRLSLAWPAGAPANARRVLVAGANDVGDFAVRMIRRSPALNLRPVGFLDEAGAHTGRTIQGLPIVGSLTDLGPVLRDLSIAEVLIALPDAGPDVVTRIVEQCRQHEVAVRVLPSQNELIAGRRTLGALRSVDVAELLGRARADQRLGEEMNYVRGKIVLVTGAGGSIGSELCRQIADLEPERMVMVGRGENSLFELMQRLGGESDSRRYVVADIRDERKMATVFTDHRPALVFHAAAHKHVPLMEMAPDEAVKNNIFATDLMARLADSVRAERLVQISTDKAVRPSSMMGASKRVAEQVISAWAARSETRFVSVRFGNVLGSRGSVIPLFRRQIERGGPVTVTHPDAERYFMTVEEAVSLVLRAGAIAESGQLCVLDMGDPVKIDEMARNLITLSGLEPERDVPIEYVGLRPGEKIKEEYLSSQEGLEKTAVGKVWVTRPEPPDLDALRGRLDQLSASAAAGDIAGVRRVFAELIPDHRLDSGTDEV